MVRSGVCTQYLPNLRHPYQYDDTSLQIVESDRMSGLWPAVLAAILPEVNTSAAQIWLDGLYGGTASQR